MPRKHMTHLTHEIKEASKAVVLNQGSIEPPRFDEAVSGVRHERPLKDYFFENFAQPKVSYYQKQQRK